MKKVIMAAAIMASSLGANAQLKVHSNGYVSVGTLTSSAYKLTIEGYNALNVKNGNYFMRFGAAPANGVIGGVINDKIAFWDSSTGHHQLDAQTFHVTSDSSMKTKISPMTNEHDVLSQLKTYTYYFKDEVTRNQNKIHYGFLAQEVKELLPSLIDSSMGTLVMNIDEFIPLLVKTAQDQKQIIENQAESIASLQTEVNELRDLVYKIGEYAGMDLTQENIKPAAVLYQNSPNPFKESTQIKFELPKTYNSASIIVFDMAGVMLENFDVSARDNGELTIEGKQFKPGMYLYSLVVDDVEIDTKKMILNK